MKIEMAPSVMLENLEDLYFELVPKHIDLRKKRPTYLSKEKKRNSQLLGIDAIKEAFVIATNNSKTGKTTLEELQKELDKKFTKDIMRLIEYDK